MKGGGIIGILGGTLGTALLTKGMKSGGSALLGSLLQTAVGTSGGKGSGKGSGGGGKSGGLGESLLDAAVSGLTSGLTSGKSGGKGSGKGSGRGGAGGGGGGGKGRGKGGKAQDEAPLSELLEKTMDAFQSREGKRHESRAMEAPEEKGDDKPAGEAVIDIEVRSVEQSTRERREHAILLLNETTVSALPGRVRLRHEAFKEPAVQALRSGLLGAGMDDAAFNAKTGSVLLTYDSAKLDAATFLEAVLPLGEFLLDWQG